MKTTSETLEVRRLRCFEVSDAFYPMAMQTGITFEIIEGVPSNAKLVHMGHDRDKCIHFFVCEHESFDLVPEGGAIPRGTVKFRKVLRHVLTPQEMEAVKNGQG